MNFFIFRCSGRTGKSTCRHAKLCCYLLYCVVMYQLFVFLFFIFTANALKNQDGIVYNSIVYFTNHVTENPNGPAPLKLRKIIDMVKNNI